MPCPRNNVWERAVDIPPSRQESAPTLSITGSKRRQNIIPCSRKKWLERLLLTFTYGQTPVGLYCCAGRPFQRIPLLISSIWVLPSNYLSVTEAAAALPERHWCFKHRFTWTQKKAQWYSSKSPPAQWWSPTVVWPYAEVSNLLFSHYFLLDRIILCLLFGSEMEWGGVLSHHDGGMSIALSPISMHGQDMGFIA